MYVLYIILYRLSDGCIQCAGTDDDNDGDDFDLDDERRLQSERVGLESQLVYTVTADVPDGEDPMAIMAAVENDLNEFFKDEENARVTWITKARELGSPIAEDAQVIFYAPEAAEESVVVNGPVESDDDNNYVLIGSLIGAGAAVVGLMVSARYGVKAYQRKHGANEVVEDMGAGGEMTMNPLGLGEGVHRRTTSGGGGGGDGL